MKYGRKITGGRYKKQKKKRLYERAGQKKTTKLGEEAAKTSRITGGNTKTSLLRTKKVNIQKKGKTIQAEIKNVVETPSDKFLARQNIITKGTILDTDKGKVKVTSRPTQDGIVNGILVE